MIRRTFIAVAMATGLGLSVGAHAQTKWDLASAYPSFNFHVQTLEQFSKDVQAATKGSLVITTHPGASLFKGPEIKRAVQGGQVQAGEFFMSAFQNEWQLFGADGLPFLASSYDSAFKLYQAQKPFLTKKLDEQGMALLYALPWPPQGIYTKKPINSVADMRGLKWRANNPTSARVGELAGAQPLTIQEAEVSQALATGVVDSLITSSSTGADNKLYESLGYYYDVQAWIPKNAVVVNKRAFAALDNATRDAVLKAAAAAEERGWKESQKVNAEALETLKKGGMRIETPSETLKADLAKLGETIVKEWSSKAGADGAALLEAYRAGK